MNVYYHVVQIAEITHVNMGYQEIKERSVRDIFSDFLCKKLYIINIGIFVDDAKYESIYSHSLDIPTFVTIHYLYIEWYYKIQKEVDKSCLCLSSALSFTTPSKIW